MKPLGFLAHPHIRMSHRRVPPADSPEIMFRVPAAVRERLRREVMRRGPERDVADAARGAIGQGPLRRLRSSGAVVEVRLCDSARPVGREVAWVAFRHIQGDGAAAWSLVARWRRRFDLWLDVRRSHDTGGKKRVGQSGADVRPAAQVIYPRHATMAEAFRAVIDECLDQVLCNAALLCEGDPSTEFEGIHQLRVGLRRLRTALRCFRGWIASPSDELLVATQGLFDVLGEARDADVRDGDIARELALAGAPVEAAVVPQPKRDVSALLRDGDSQGLLLDWLTWRASLAAADLDMPDAWPRPVERRLRRWHERIVAAGTDIAQLDEPAIHRLRRHIKRQRYAVEFFAPLLKPREVERYVEPLARLQDRMGRLTDLYSARAHQQARTERDPAAWFALGWLAARIDGLRLDVARAARRLADVSPPSRHKNAP